VWWGSNCPYLKRMLDQFLFGLGGDCRNGPNGGLGAPVLPRVPDVGGSKSVERVLGSGRMTIDSIDLGLVVYSRARVNCSTAAHSNPSFSSFTFESRPAIELRFTRAFHGKGCILAGSRG